MTEKTTYLAIQVFKFEEPPKLTSLDIPTPGPNKLLVKIEFAPVNPIDFLIAKGHVPTGFQLPFTLGYEGSGTVVEVGPDCKIAFKSGDRVSVVAVAGTWAEYAVIDSDDAYPIAPENTFEEAACHWVSPGTTLLMVEEVVKGEHKACIQSAAASAVGKMFIRTLKDLSIKSINLVRR